MGANYNGWHGKTGEKFSAYATWKIALELFDGFEWDIAFDSKPSEETLAEYLEDTAYTFVADQFAFDCKSGPHNLVRDWAECLLDEVDWWEIAENILLDWEEE